MTLYDELFETYETLTANELPCTVNEYSKQSVFPSHMVVSELDRLCEEGEFIQDGNEYKVFVPSMEALRELL